MAKKKKIEPICKNCLAYDKYRGQCKVVIMHDGERFNLPMEPEDRCFFLEETSYTNESGGEEKFTVDVEQVAFWCEDPTTGERADKGIVKIEYPEGFFGKEVNE